MVFISTIIEKIGLEQRVLEFNTAIDQIVRDSEDGLIPAIPRGSLRLVDHYSSFYPPSMLGKDGFHPNEYGYTHMGYIYFQSLRYLPMHMVRISEEEQAGPAGSLIPEALKVQVTDDYGNGVEGTEILFEVTDGDALILESDVITTDSLGFASAHVQIIIVNSLGQQVAMLLDEDREKGFHEVVWHGTDYHGISLFSGCYFYVLSSGKTRLVKKMELLQ